MAFKNKTKNRNPFNENKNIDQIHNDVLKEFNKNKKNLSNYYQNLDMLNKQIIYLRNEIDKDKEIYNNFHLQEKKWAIEDERDRIQSEINNIKDKKDETNYLLKTGILLNQYYKIKDNKSSNVITKNQQKKRKELIKDNKKDVLCWLEKPNNNISYNIANGKEIIKTTKEKKQEIKELLLKDQEQLNEMNEQFEIEKEKQQISQLKRHEKDNIEKETKLLNINNNKNIYESLTKKELYTKYMKLIDNNYDDNDYTNIKTDICEYCNTEMLLNQNAGVLICSNCGIQEQIILDSDKPSYKDPPKEMTSFCYKRINHLNEFLAQFQAKETTDIPEEIYNEILLEIKKERIKNMADITPEKMRILLRKIKRNDYYEHIPYIINQLNGLEPPIISGEVEDIIRNMFKEIQVPFEELRHTVVPKRKNFLSYNYVMYKFFELLELDEYLNCFMLLKSRNKLHQQDLIWKHICSSINWQYIPSI